MYIARVHVNVRTSTIYMYVARVHVHVRTSTIYMYIARVHVHVRTSTIYNVLKNSFSCLYSVLVEFSKIKFLKLFPI